MKTKVEIKKITRSVTKDGRVELRMNLSDGTSKIVHPFPGARVMPCGKIPCPALAKILYEDWLKKGVA